MRGVRLMSVKTKISEIAIKSIAYGFRIPSLKAVADFNQIEKTMTLLKELEINVLLDVGANRGKYAKHIRDAGYCGHIFSFEPIQSDCERIERLASSDKKWTVLNFALGAENGSKEFNLIELGGHTVLSSFLSAKNGLPSTTKTVSIRRLDDVLPELIFEIRAPKIFLKMDTQGYDHHVVDGVRSHLHLVRGLQSEISVIPLYNGMRPYTESLSDYGQLGFVLVDLFVVNRTKTGSVLEYDCLMQRA
jgi:FkbM family methyltransferase